MSPLIGGDMETKPAGWLMRPALSPDEVGKNTGFNQSPLSLVHTTEQV
jgi:hypothetical protein